MLAEQSLGLAEELLCRICATFSRSFRLHAANYQQHVARVRCTSGPPNRLEVRESKHRTVGTRRAAIGRWNENHLSHMHWLASVSKSAPPRTDDRNKRTGVSVPPVKCCNCSRSRCSVNGSLQIAITGTRWLTKRWTSRCMYSSLSAACESNSITNKVVRSRAALELR